MRRLGVVATARASFYLYNRKDEVDALIDGIRASDRIFGNVARVAAG
jgi:cysteine desulfurase/selenocysteine lyase